MEFKVIEGDITEQQVDAIVNAANTDIQMGGGVAEAIKEAAGSEIQREATEKAPIELGGATWTDGYNLNVEYVIHAATMHLEGSASEETVRKATRNALRMADELGCNSVILPALGCGTGGLELKKGARYIFEEILDYESTSLENVSVIGYNEDSFRQLVQVSEDIRKEK